MTTTAITTVNLALIENVFASYPELAYGSAALTYDSSHLIIQFRVKSSFSFDVAKQGKVLVNWLGEQVGEYRHSKFENINGELVIIYKAALYCEFELITKLLPN